MTQIRNLPESAVYEGSLILVNAHHPLRCPPRAPLSPICGRADMLLQRAALTLLDALMEETGGWGKIIPVSAWRDQAEQKAIWDSSLVENGPEFTARYVAKPGCSEHQTGLAVDLGLAGGPVDFIRPEFPYTGICALFRRHAARYGFIERYPEGKEALTGIAHEPWHFRFVGMPHAQIMTELSLTLEEYLEFLREYTPSRPYRWFDGGSSLALFYLPAQGDTPLTLCGSPTYTVSGDNCGGFVVTQWGAAG